LGHPEDIIMKHGKVKSLLLEVALLCSANAEAGWAFGGNGPNGKLYFRTPVEYDIQYAYTIFWVRLSRPVDIRGWRYDARSIGSDVLINCDIGSITFRSLVAFTNSNLSGRSVRLASFGPIRPGSTFSYSSPNLSPVGRAVIDRICR
jgi:hypothetical protein